MSNQKDDAVHCFQLQCQTTPNISDVEGLSFHTKHRHGTISGKCKSNHYSHKKGTDTKESLYYSIIYP